VPHDPLGTAVQCNAYGNTSGVNALTCGAAHCRTALQRVNKPLTGSFQS